MPESNDQAPLEVVPASETPEETEERKGRGKGELSKEVIASLLALNPDEHASHVKAGQKELWEILHRQMKREAKHFAPRELVIAYGILTDKLMTPMSAPQQLHQHNTVVINGLSRKDALKALGVATKGDGNAAGVGRQVLPSGNVPLPRLGVASRGLPAMQPSQPAATPVKHVAIDTQSLDTKGSNA